MKVTSKNIMTIAIEVNEEEARWLHSLTQNALESTPEALDHEPQKDRTIRCGLFNQLGQLLN